MSRSSALIVLGLLAMLVPVSGLPSVLRALITAALGAFVLIVGISMRAEHARRSRAAKNAAPAIPETPPESSAASSTPLTPPTSVSPI